MSTKPAGFGGWNQHPARELPPLTVQRECLEDCELYPIPVHSTRFTEASTIGMRRKAGDTCLLLSMRSIFFASPASHVNPTTVNLWLWTLQTRQLSQPHRISHGTRLCNGSRAFLHIGARSILPVVLRAGLPIRAVTL